MQLRAAGALAGLLLVACNPGTTSVATKSPSVSGSPSSVPCAASTTYGLLMVAGTLELISPAGCIAAKTAVAAPSVAPCSDGLPAVLAPPVSASNDKVYFRDGDTRIRYLTPDGHTADATSVPGDASTVSFFSVSPDDQRIAVLVEDMSSASSIKLRLYVEDLAGGGHHADIYAQTITKDGNGMTLWPVGWHQAQLVLAVVPACSAAPIFKPVAWHVVDPATAQRKVNIDVSTCYASVWVWPSPAGTACYDINKGMWTTDWTGRVRYLNRATGYGYYTLGVSPSGQDVFVEGAPGLWTKSMNGGADVTTQGTVACLWINDSSMLGPDSVVAFPSGTVTKLASSGECAGRFPGAL